MKNDKEKSKIAVCKILIKNKENKFLAIKESENKDKISAGQWEIPGGKIKDNEDRFEAAKRELEEETSLEVENIEDLVRLELESEEIINCYVLYAETSQTEITLEQGITDFKWITPEEAFTVDWHRDAAYNIVPLNNYKKYLETKKDYGSGRQIEVVKTLIRNDSGKFLAVRKSHIEKISSGQKFKKYGDMSGKWELPGGRVGKRRGENKFEAAEREILEELNLKLSDGKSVVREEIEEENNVNVHILVYNSDDWSGEIKLSNEHDDYKWVSPEEYLRLDWHMDAGYGYPPMKFLEEYLS